MTRTPPNDCAAVTFRVWTAICRAWRPVVAAGRGGACRVPLWLLLAMLLLAAAGCGSKRKIEAVKKFDLSGSGVTLEQAYAKLLTAPVWDRIKLDPENFIRVSGDLQGGEGSFEAYYTDSAVPPKLLFFTVSGKRLPGKDFASYLSDRILHRELAGAAPQAPAGGPASP